MSSSGWGLWSKVLARAGVGAPSLKHVQLLPGAVPRLPSENFLGQDTLSWKGESYATETHWSLKGKGFLELIPAPTPSCVPQKPQDPILP